jgi:hypothetical protein
MEIVLERKYENKSVLDDNCILTKNKQYEKLCDQKQAIYSFEHNKTKINNLSNHKQINNIITQSLNSLDNDNIPNKNNILEFKTAEYSTPPVLVP